MLYTKSADVEDQVVCLLIYKKKNGVYSSTKIIDWLRLLALSSLRGALSVSLGTVHTTASC